MQRDPTAALFVHVMRLETRTGNSLGHAPHVCKKDNLTLDIFLSCNFYFFTIFVTRFFLINFYSSFFFHLSVLVFRSQFYNVFNIYTFVIFCCYMNSSYILTPLLTSYFIRTRESLFTYKLSLIYFIFPPYLLSPFLSLRTLLSISQLLLTTIIKFSRTTRANNIPKKLNHIFQTNLL